MTVESYDPNNDPGMAVTMSDAALAHTRKKLAEHEGAIGMRLGAKKSGCSGFKYVVDYVTEITSEDKVFSVADGVDVFVCAEDLSFVGGTRLDYVQEGIQRVLKFENPRAKDTCGCGESFSV